MGGLKYPIFVGRIAKQTASIRPQDPFSSSRLWLLSINNGPLKVS